MPSIAMQGYHKNTEDTESLGYNLVLKNNQNTPRPSEHPPVMGEKMSKRLGGIKRLQIQPKRLYAQKVQACFDMY